MKRHEFVFDLDDTLYSERSYAVSALRYFGHRIDGLGTAGNSSTDSPGDVTRQLLSMFDAGEKDPIGTVCKRLSIDAGHRQSLIVEMQAHLPDISLREDARQFLSLLKSAGRSFSIITDGRGVTQRAKIKALGLTDAKMVQISEEVGVSKPHKRSFETVAALDHYADYIYIGDNPLKDFVAPNQLGWITVMLRNRGDNVHTQTGDFTDLQKPSACIDSLCELEAYL
ncbi:MAG: HAD family hydrolase [Granulosicoccus sp.]|nr:HAD family hydrolase [Granulosicoccus sp.]